MALIEVYQSIADQRKEETYAYCKEELAFTSRKNCIPNFVVGLPWGKFKADRYTFSVGVDLFR